MALPKSTVDRERKKFVTDDSGDTAVRIKSPDTITVDATGQGDVPTTLDGEKIQITDGLVAGQLRLDRATEGVPILDYSHHEIHNGNHFYVAGTQDIANNANLDFLWVCPNTDKWAHALWELDSEVEMTMSLYEDVITSDNGTSKTVFNNNRNSETTATVLAYTTPTLNSGSLGDGSDGGTLVWQKTIGSGKKLGGQGSRDHEFVGKRNTKYWFRIANSSGNTGWINYDFYWYELVDIN